MTIIPEPAVHRRRRLPEDERQHTMHLTSSAVFFVKSDIVKIVSGG
jgi:hypothetical protein